MKVQSSKFKVQNYIIKLKKLFIWLLVFSFTFNFSLLTFNYSYAQEASSSAVPTPSFQEEKNTSTPSAIPTPQIQDHLDSLSGQIIFDAPGSSANESAQFKIPTEIKKLSKSNYSADEAVTVTIENTLTENTEIKLFDADNRRVDIDTETVHNIDPTVIKILPPEDFKPGKYTLNIRDSEGKESSQNFTWGVLAINPNKSLYLPSEIAQLSLAVLDEKGNMVCDAKLTLEIKDPQGVAKILSTNDETIIRNEECFIKDFTTKPDYETSYLTTAIGVYDMTLTAETKNGTYSITDSFEVKEELAFDIERQSATRIYPPKEYPMKITLTANQDFQGEIREIVPTDFSIASLSGAFAFKETRIVTSGQTKNEITDNNLSIIYPFTGNYETTADFGVDVEDPLLKSKYDQAGLFGHDGVDYALPMGTPVIAVDNGTISYIGDEPYGKTVIIQHAWGRSYYGHLSETLLQTNDVVAIGDKIALSGSTGLSTGPHLHFGIRLNQYDQTNGYYGKINPLPYLNATSFVPNAESVQLITWEVNLKKGDQINLGYTFKAPQVSPELYLLGPLTLYEYYETDLLHTFQEARQWQIAADAISFSNLGASNGQADNTATTPDINSNTDATSYSTSSWTPPTSGLIILYVHSRNADGLNSVSSVTGNSLTWTQIATVQYANNSNQRLTLFGADASGSTTGQTTIDFGANTQIHAVASFFTATGVDLSGGVAAAFVQTASNHDGGPGGTTGTVTLSAASNSENRPIVAFTHQENEDHTNRTNWTELDDMSGTAQIRGFSTQYRSDTFETTATATWTTSARWGGLAAELKMAATGPTNDQLIRHGGWFSNGVEQPFTF